MIHAKLPDGTTLEFPDGTDEKVVQRVVKKHLGVSEEPAPEANGMLQTFTEAALQAGTLDQYDSMKAWKNDTTEEKVQGQLNRDWEENPWSGRAGWLLGNVGMGGVVGMAGKQAVKQGAKQLAKRVPSSTNTVNKAMAGAGKLAANHRKKAAFLQGAAGSVGYDTAYKALEGEDMTVGGALGAAALGGAGGMAGRAISNVGSKIYKKVPEVFSGVKKKADDQVFFDAEEGLKKATTKGSMTSSQLKNLRGTLNSARNKSLAGTQGARYQDSILNELDTVIDNIGENGSVKLKDLNIVKQVSDKNYSKGASSSDREFIKKASKSLAEAIDEINMRGRVEADITSQINKTRSRYGSVRPKTWEGVDSKGRPTGTHREMPRADGHNKPQDSFKDYLAHSSARQRFEKITDKLSKATTLSKRSALKQDAKFMAEVEKLTKNNPEAERAMKAFWKNGPTRWVRETLANTGQFGQAALLGASFMGGGGPAMVAQLAAIVATKATSARAHAKLIKDIERGVKLGTLPRNKRAEVVKHLKRTGYKKSNHNISAPIGGILAGGTLTGENE